MSDFVKAAENKQWGKMVRQPLKLFVERSASAPYGSDSLLVSLESP